MTDLKRAIAKAGLTLNCAEPAQGAEDCEACLLFCIIAVIPEGD